MVSAMQPTVTERLKDALSRALAWALPSWFGQDDDDQRAVRAQAHLKKALVGALGRELPGITGYGARWDKSVGGMSLGVFVDEAEDARSVEHKLPTRIDDLPVRVIARQRPRAHSA